MHEALELLSTELCWMKSIGSNIKVLPRQKSKYQVWSCIGNGKVQQSFTVASQNITRMK